MVLYQSRHDTTEYGRLAQLVEHLLDVQEVTGSSPVPSTTKIPSQMTRDFLRERYRTRTAAEPTAACGGNREARLGPRTSATASVGMSTKKAPPAGAPFAEPRLGGTGQEQCKSEPFVKNKGRVSPWRWYPAFFASGMVFRLMVWYTRLNKSEFERSVFNGKQESRNVC